MEHDGRVYEAPGPWRDGRAMPVRILLDDIEREWVKLQSHQSLTDEELGDLMVECAKLRHRLHNHNAHALHRRAQADRLSRMHSEPPA